MDCLRLGGELHTASFYSESLNADFNFMVYLPPCYTSEHYSPYPVIYLLHGLSYDDDQWVRIGLVEHMDQLTSMGTIPPTIVVLPHESVLAAPQVSNFDQAITQELIPYIDQQYSTNTAKAFRAIGGVSRGAGWSVRIGFENPTLFSKIGAHSLALFEADGGKIIGWLIQTPKADLPEVLIDIGRDDREWQTAQNFADLLDDYNIPHEWYLFTGDHNEAYWSDHLDFYLSWYTRDW
jgi:enterochelin esterase-like enzyme